MTAVDEEERRTIKTFVDNLMLVLDLNVKRKYFLIFFMNYSCLSALSNKTNIKNFVDFAQYKMHFWTCNSVCVIVTLQ